VNGWAIIFDVDGVLLELTRAEEELFFQPFGHWLDQAKLSRDWNSYAVRNDEEIVREICARHGLPEGQAAQITQDYLGLLEGQLAQRQLLSMPIPGAAELLAALEGRARLGIATANFRKAAELRLAQAGFWPKVSGLAFGADGGGPKAAILARAIAASGLAPGRIIFIGDNLNDVDAGLANNVHFIGFSTDAARRASLRARGALHLAGSHDITAQIISSIMHTGA
jgi:phosphoglycolate phosphatase-like HAD superfamily hydrolase